MINSPIEDEQIAIVIKNLLPLYSQHLFAQYLPNFKALITVGRKIEDASNSSQIRVNDETKYKKSPNF